MFCRPHLAFAIVVSLGIAALAPDTAAAFGFGHERLATFGSSVTPFTPQARFSDAAISRARFRCHSVQVGDPRKQPPMLVCP